MASSRSSFCEQKEPKKLHHFLGFAVHQPVRYANGNALQKFFAAFFQKGSASLPSLAGL